MRFAIPFAALLVAACSSSNPIVPMPDAGSTDAGQVPDADEGPIEIDGGPCKTTFRFVPPAGTSVSSVQVTGEWNQFKNPGIPMVGPDEHGAYTAKVELPVGFFGYKLIVDGNWQLDPSARWRKYVSGIENSGVRVTDCKLPILSLGRQKIGSDSYEAHIAYAMGQNQSRIDRTSAKATLRHDGAAVMIPVTIDANGDIDVQAKGLAPGKYTLLVDAKDRAGRAAKTLRLVFWIEGETFDWRDALIWMGVTDRVKNGDTSNDVPKEPNVDDRANFQNGDLEGMRQLIASGWLDKLGVRAIWLTPFNTNATGSYLSDDGVHLVTSYHGYWPVKARQVDPRLGGDAALEKFVWEAHAHGIRVLMDFVANHVHNQHEYFLQHPEWFRTGCICGTSNCDWTAHRLDCLFASYMPDVDWTNNDASEQFTDDAVWWIERFDLDGLRIDAVKHVEDAAIINLSGKVRQELEASGTKVFLMGETAMGWSDCGLGCNKDQYDTISRYIGPMGLDGQFDFVLYHAVPYRSFARDDRGMLHADYWAQASTWMYPQGSIMTPYIGSHDTPRFVTLATYRNQNGYPDYIPGNKWSNYAGPPPDAEPYSRHRAALSWLLGLPGAPLLYYGDEYGEWGGADPNNRVLWRGDKPLSSEEQATLDLARKLGQARKELVALRRGAYRSVKATEEVLLFARQTTDDKAALVAVSKVPAPRTITATLPLTLSVMNGQTLKDRLGGPDVTVSGNGTLSVTLAPRGAAILAP
jgi:glycosidase